jgi:hypothetical protein
VHVGVGAIAGAAFDGRVRAMAELVNVILHAPMDTRFTDQVGPDFGRDDFINKYLIILLVSQYRQ